VLVYFFVLCKLFDSAAFCTKNAKKREKRFFIQGVRKKRKRDTNTGSSHRQAVIRDE
jgi:hypothetical protein